MVIHSSVRYKPLLISILIPLAIGGLSGFLIRGAMGEYQALTQPPFSPPGFVFPILWGIRYLLMGIASFLVYQKNSGTTEKHRALRLYAISLILNFLWPILFFNLHAYWLSFFLLLFLLVIVFLTTIAFCSVSRNAARLLFPYLIWLFYAGYLNLGVAILNKAAITGS